jgi:hypothetical protein
MTTPEYEIGEKIEDTEAFGTVVVKDLFRSVTNPDWFCYRVENLEGVSFLVTEEEIFTTEEPDDE